MRLHGRLIYIYVYIEEDLVKYMLMLGYKVDR